MKDLKNADKIIGGVQATITEIIFDLTFSANSRVIFLGEVLTQKKVSTFDTIQNSESPNRFLEKVALAHSGFSNGPP